MIIYHIIHTIHIASHHHINIEYFAQSNFTARPSGPSLGRARAVTEALVDVNGMKIDMSTVSLQRLDFLLTDLGRICWETLCKRHLAEMCTSLHRQGEIPQCSWRQQWKEYGVLHESFLHRLPGVCIWSHWFRQGNGTNKSTYHLQEAQPCNCGHFAASGFNCLYIV